MGRSSDSASERRGVPTLSLRWQRYAPSRDASRLDDGPTTWTPTVLIAVRQDDRRVQHAALAGLRRDVLHYRAPLHHEYDAPQRRDVFRRIAVDPAQVRLESRRDRADRIAQRERLRRERRGPDD